MKLYLDLAVVLNFLVDFLLVLGTNRLSGYPPRAGRAALAAGLGGIYGGACLLPGFRFLGGTLWRLVCLGSMGLVAFGWSGSGARRGALFVLLSMALGGIALGLGHSGFFPLVAAAAGVVLLCVIGFRGRAGGREYVTAELVYGDRSLRLTALRDTGNTLRDPVTGESVLIAGADVAERLIGLTKKQLQNPVETVSEGAVRGLRLIPYRAVGKEGGCC